MRSPFNLVLESPPPRWHIPSLMNQNALAGIATALIIAGLALFNTKQYVGYRFLLKEKQKVQEAHTKFNKILDEIDRINVERTRLQQRKALIEQLRSERLVYPKLMETLASIVPARLWLTQLSALTGPAGISIDLAAIAFDNYAVADLLSGFERKPELFSDLQFGGITGSGGASENSTVSFQMKIQYHPPREASNDQG